MAANLEIAILDPVHNNHPPLAAGSLTVSGTVLSPKDVEQIQVDGWIIVLGFPVPLLAGPAYIPAPGGPPPQGTWTLDFQNVPPGMHQLMVRATARDDEGNWWHSNDELLINVSDEQAPSEPPVAEPVAAEPVVPEKVVPEEAKPAKKTRAPKPRSRKR